MFKPIALPASALLLFAATACSDQTVSTSPQMTAARSAANATSIVSGGSDRMVSMMDACDHDSFTAQGVLCTRNGGVTFPDLIGQLQAHGSAGAWHNSPSEMDAKVGLTLLAVNKGGEIHTFTKVAHFGGGFVPEINGVLGLNPVSECLALLTPGHNDDFILPGGADSDDEVTSGTSLYQCCIHPWMRTVVHGRS